MGYSLVSDLLKVDPMSRVPSVNVISRPFITGSQSTFVGVSRNVTKDHAMEVIYGFTAVVGKVRSRVNANQPYDDLDAEVLEGVKLCESTLQTFTERVMPSINTSAAGAAAAGGVVGVLPNWQERKEQLLKEYTDASGDLNCAHDALHALDRLKTHFDSVLEELTKFV